MNKMKLLSWSVVVIGLVLVASGFIAPGHCQDNGDGTYDLIVPDLGRIEGSVESTIPAGLSGGKIYYSFSGIPYADPASYTGRRRFMPSRIREGPLEPEPGRKFIARDKLVRCPQVDVLNGWDTTDLKVILKLWGKRKRDEAYNSEAALPLVRGQEDCLVLNVNTHNITDDPDDKAKLVPVIVFIHGGSWAGLWGGIFGGERFLTKDVVFVSLNYRLGILGSLNLGINDAPGNGAMYDIITALKWVKRYIRYFGGDPERVTVAGQSAGAMLASHLLTTPLIIDDDDGEQLIHGLIGLSGSSLSPIGTCLDPMTHHLRISTHAGCYNGPGLNPNLNEVRECMAEKTLEQLIGAMTDYSRSERLEARFGMDARVPSLQNPGLDPFLVPLFMPEPPHKVLEDKRQLNIPVMMGTTRHDGGFLLEDTFLQYIQPHNYTYDDLFLRNELIPALMEGLGLQDPSGELYHTIARIYLGDAVYKDGLRVKIPGLLDIHSVFIFKAAAYQLIEMHSNLNLNSFYFSFEHKGMWTLDGGLVVPGGIGHIDSLFYLFKAYPLVSPLDLAVSQRFINYWTNFVIYGNPNGYQTITGPGPKIQTAAPFNPINHAYLIIRSIFDYTGYYCRDDWVGNSLELQPIEAPPPTTREPTTPTSTPTPPQTSTQGGSSLKIFTLFQTILVSFSAILLFKAYL